jgi:hypothetical protein
MDSEVSLMYLKESATDIIFIQMTQIHFITSSHFQINLNISSHIRHYFLNTYRTMHLSSSLYVLQASEFHLSATLHQATSNIQEFLKGPELNKMSHLYSVFLQSSLLAKKTNGVKKTERFYKTLVIN